MQLYHFTGLEEFGAMLFTDGIKAHDLRLSKGRNTTGLCGVWLTTKPDLDIPHGLPAEKREVRITVEIPEKLAKRWRNFARRYGVSQSVINEIATSGANSWRISPLWIRQESWVEAIDTDTGEVIASREFLDALPEIAALAYNGRAHIDQLADRMGDEFEPDTYLHPKPGAALTRTQILCHAAQYADQGASPVNREILLAYAKGRLQ